MRRPGKPARNTQEWARSEKALHMVCRGGERISRGSSPYRTVCGQEETTIETIYTRQTTPLL
jgi:hypothetical protein